MKKLIISLLPPFLSCCRLLAAQEESPSEHFEFSQEMRSYFSDELTTPAPVTSSGPSEDTESYYRQFQNLPPIANKPEPTASETQTKIHAQFQDGTWKLTFTFPHPVFYREKTSCGTLEIEFNQAFDSPDWEKTGEQLGYLIKRLASGYHAISLTANRSVFYHTAAFGNAFVLEIIPDYQAPLQNTHDVQYARARLLVEQHYYNPAICALVHLLEKYPNDKDVLLLRATVEGLLPRWQKQVQILRNLVRQYPTDEEIRTLYDDAYCPHTPYFRFERQLQRTVGMAAVQIYDAQMEDILSCGPCHVLYGGTEFQVWSGHISVGSIMNSKGNNVGFDAATSQVSVYMRQEWDSGTELTGIFYAQSKAIFGFGATAVTLLPCIQGQLTFTAAWHRPYWEIFQAEAYGGREDIIQCQIDAVINRYYNWTVNGGAHQVGIIGTPNGFTSLLANGDFFCNLLLINPIIVLNYNLEAEYVLQENVKIGVNGLPFNPVPLSNYEYHTLKAYYYYTFRDRWFLKLYGGASYNRYGGTLGPTYGASLKYVKPCPCGWEFEISLDHFPSTVVAGSVVDYYTANLKIHF